ncbi:hypothetical protein HSACCH_01062 [Halanaerobium saccharolyticum subsp. saccharolyticum DSM 6643]|uniref:Uncharacterized protein n=1 Tax=Halanaerobium saccharolyticum subsp. saccharolyticum DSM 6643 TaxID=1293054 RepID=M5E0K3_9FIRM|nr:hypothetical protein HSACCH_01062 [Halanaerobium saccharolyticum subsp. saccharolyticum DSM 6643]
MQIPERKNRIKALKEIKELMNMEIRFCHQIMFLNLKKR